MSNPQPTTHQPTPNPRDLTGIAKQLPGADKGTLDALDAKGGEGYSEKLVDAIEMIGEEETAGVKPPDSDAISPALRFLHSSRTIHQLVTDRNKAVGIFLTVASLLLTASGIIVRVEPTANLLIPVEIIHRWCLPITFAVLTVLSVFVALLLIRTRVGLIYEVAKMNALLGLPVGRVSRISPLSIFFIMQAIISLAGGLCGALFTIFLMYRANPTTLHAALWGTVVGVLLTLALMFLYIVTVNATTSDRRLQQGGK